LLRELPKATFGKTMAIIGWKPIFQIL